MKFGFYLYLFAGLGALWFTHGCAYDHDVSNGTQEYPEEYMYAQRAFPFSKIDPAAQSKALKQTMQKKADVRSIQDTWRQLGPFNIGGRVTDVALHPTNEDIMYIGASVGGVWRSTDGGREWEAIFEQAGAYSIGNIGISPANPDVIYVGTGEANASASSGAYRGDGIWKSMDGGDTWSYMGLPESHHIGRIVVDPEDENRLFVAVAGHLYGANDERGVYRSLNGGADWERVLFVNDSTACIDLVMNPLNSDVLYAATWERIRYASKRSYAGLASGIHKSTDGGRTWERLVNGLPVREDVGRIGLGMSKADTNVVFAVYTEDPVTNQFDAIYRSDNEGLSWSRVDDGSLGNAFSSFGWFFGNIRVHPETVDSVYLLGLYTSVSGDNGFNWDLHTPTWIHVDQHAYEFHPKNSNLRVIGNDGGVYITRDGGGAWEHVNVLPISQFYTSNIDPQQPSNVYGGMQDNGTARSSGSGINNWERIYGGDGFYVNIDPRNSDMIYAESQWGGLVRSEDGGYNWEWALNGIDFVDRNNWNTPVILDPQNPDVLYYGTQRLYRSTDRALWWDPISDDLTDPVTSASDIGTLSTIAVAPTDSNTIYVGTDDGYIQRTTDMGETWHVISQELPVRYVTRIAVDPVDPLTVYATFSGYRNLDYTPHVFKSNDGGDNWEDISGDLPEMPVNDIIVDPQVPGALYLATDMAVWYTRNDGLSWDLLGEGFPMMIVNDLTYHDETRTLIAGTYGRSMFSYNLGTVTSSRDLSPKEHLEVRLFPNPATNMINLEMPDNTAPETYEIFDDLGKRVGFGPVLSSPVQLDITDYPAGIYTIRISGKEIGLQRFVKAN